MSIFDLFKPVRRAPPIQESGSQVQAEYKYWRIRIFYSIYTGYIFYYLTRKSFTFAMKPMMDDLGMQLSEVGILGTVFALIYGASKFFSGILADRSNARAFMAFGLILTGLFNILFGMSSSMALFGVFWGMNALFQGWGAPPCARLLTHWYSQKERGTWWGVWNTSHSVGGALIPLMAGLLAQYFGWRYSMYVPGVLCIGMGLVLLNRLRDTPESLGLPAVEQFKNEEPPSKEPEKKLSVKEILFKYVLGNPYIWILVISYFFVYIIRQSINDYGPIYLASKKGYSLIAANTSITLFEAGGVCGSLLAGWLSDRIFAGRRGPINIFFSLGVVLAMAGLYFTPAGYVFFDYALMFAIGFFIFGPQMLIGMAAVELSHKKAAGTATGFAGWWAYAGSAVAGYPVSKVVEVMGWGGFFGVLEVCGGVAALFLLPVWNAKAHPRYGALPQQEKRDQPEAKETAQSEATSGSRREKSSLSSTPASQTEDKER